MKWLMFLIKIPQKQQEIPTVYSFQPPPLLQILRVLCEEGATPTHHDLYLKMIQKLQFTNWLFLFQGNETREIFFLLRSTRLMTPQEKFEKKSKYITYPCTFTYSHIHTLYPCSFSITTTIVYNFSDFYTCGYLKYAK